MTIWGLELASLDTLSFLTEQLISGAHEEREHGLELGLKRPQ